MATKQNAAVKSVAIAFIMPNAPGLQKRRQSQHTDDPLAHVKLISSSQLHSEIRILSQHHLPMFISLGGRDHTQRVGNTDLDSASIDS